MRKLTAAALIALGLMTTAPAFAQTATATPPPPSAPPPPACAGPEYGQFSFWVGRWDVYPTGKDRLVAHSLIESVYDGCAVRENWMPLKGQPGGSLSGYSSVLKGWRQTWADSSGAWVDFKGGYDGKAMVLTGLWARVMPDGSDGLVRMTYTREAEGAVRQLGEVSSDGGKTWGPSFDLTYKPAK